MVLSICEESFDSRGGRCGYGQSYDNNNNSNNNNSWSQVAESTLPLTTSKIATANRGQFQASIEARSRQISTKVIVVNLVSLLANLILALIAFYFSITNNSTATTAFAADCVLDLISSAILLWRYHGDLSSVYMHAREQIACIYLGALFEISAIGIIIKSVSDFTDTNYILETDAEGSYELVYLAIVATLVCIVLTVFKCDLYKTLRDSSILLDVINTVISTVFALSIVMSQVLININPSFWYLDPVLSIVLALFMMGFGIKVIHQNFNILKPVYCHGQSHFSDSILFRSSHLNMDSQTLIRMDPEEKGGKGSIGLEPRAKNYGANLLTTSLKQKEKNWQNTDHLMIKFN